MSGRGGKMGRGEEMKFWGPGGSEGAGIVNMDGIAWRWRDYLILGVGGKKALDIRTLL
jgi:hypothetical protein